RGSADPWSDARRPAADGGAEIGRLLYGRAGRQENPCRTARAAAQRRNPRARTGPHPRSGRPEYRRQVAGRNRHLDPGADDGRPAPAGTARNRDGIDMFFGVVPVREAVGGILAHTTGAGSARFRKGRVLSAEDTAALEAAGFTQVHIARLEAGDMAEDEAATRIAEASAGPGARAAAAFTGRANLYAEAAGLARIDIERVHQLNELDEAVTIATVEDYEPIEPGQMLATVRSEEHTSELQSRENLVCR